MTRRRTTLAWLTLAVMGPVAGCAHAGAYEDFFKAIELDNGTAISDLLKRGFDPNARDPKGQKVEERNAKDESALMLAELRGNLPAARALIRLDADVNKTGWAPLHYAASGTTQDAKAMVALLLEENAYIDAASPNGTTPLMMAVRYGPGDVARLLVQEGADPTLKNELGLTALDFARQADRADMVELIAQAVRRRQPSAGKW